MTPDPPLNEAVAYELLDRMKAAKAQGGTARVWGWPAELCGPFYEANMRAIEVEQEKGRRLMWRHLGISDPLDNPNPFPHFRLFRWLP